MSVHPCLSYTDARAAIDFLQRAFGFEVLQVHDDGQGGVAHCEMRAGGGVVMLGDSAQSRERWGDHRGHGFAYVAVPEVDELCARARAAGAEIVMEPADQDYGSRDFAARDPEGNTWSFGTYVPAAEPVAGASGGASQT